MGVTWTTNWGGPAFPPCFFFNNDGVRIRTSLVTGVKLLDGLGGVRRIWDLLSSLIGERGCSGLFSHRGYQTPQKVRFPTLSLPFSLACTGVFLSILFFAG